MLLLTVIFQFVGREVRNGFTAAVRMVGARVSSALYTPLTLLLWAGEGGLSA